MYLLTKRVIHMLARVIATKDILSRYTCYYFFFPPTDVTFRTFIPSDPGLFVLNFVFEM